MVYDKETTWGWVMQKIDRSKRLKIAIIAPPWLKTGPRCYFGIENMVHHLAEALTQLGHHVELFGVGSSKTKVTRLHWYHKHGQYEHIHKPYYHTSAIIISHVLYALDFINKAGDFDIIHDHNDFLGPAILAYAGANLPPVLHTIHEPFTNDALVAKGIPDNRLMYTQFKPIDHMYFNNVSERQRATAPPELKSRLLSVIYNGVNVHDYQFSREKDDYFLSVGSIKADKGQAVAARLCKELRAKLKIAGVVAGGITTPDQMRMEQADAMSPYRGSADFKYFIHEIQPHLVRGRIEYVGVLEGDCKLELFSKAKAFLIPIQWEEPFGIVAIEALASGTPVVAYARGSMPEIIQHGVNGFLAKNEQEFKQYMQQVDQIDPEACRHSVEAKFSDVIMANKYEALYRQVIDRVQASVLSKAAA
jgi:glycosyltransferase involved in cell wall biosynthesis